VTTGFKLDPEPKPSDEGYDEYCRELDIVKCDIDFYRGFLTPPTREEHAQISAEVPLVVAQIPFVGTRDYHVTHYSRGRIGIA
jgi:hypothetical protein